MMETVQMMWGQSKGLTIGTFVTLALVLVALGVLWWMPVYFGYPLFAVLGNLVPTGITVLAVWMIRGVVRS
jgi:hypothetical protein